MLERFANVVYYVFVVLGVISFFIGFWLGYSDYTRLGNVKYLLDGFFMAIILGLPVFGIGWSIRYILIGKRSL
jgi:hypothetical protein